MSHPPDHDTNKLDNIEHKLDSLDNKLDALAQNQKGLYHFIHNIYLHVSYTFFLNRFFKFYVFDLFIQAVSREKFVPHYEDPTNIEK